ncbi:hypothetical protein PRIPAC_87031 [Pristionchus pacificus]|uniref:Phosphotransferase n=1 Tax=Pristionchus pacificus TaxID=54126 RepID=A0A2A6BT05_PRIPA|nr:hypothetical protein PRIPAC_87031 [Pristionchus pacificus]|eukprot:PDM68933.1 phosphotransferase [Pristionchus pacificus]
MNTLNISLVGDTYCTRRSFARESDKKLRVQTELTPIAKAFQNLQVPCRPTRVLKLTIDRNEENIVMIARALEGNTLNHVTFTQVLMKLIPDIAKCLIGMQSKSVTIYLEKVENAQQCHEFADVIFALKSVDDFAVDVTIQEHSEHTSLFLSVLAEKAHKLIVDIHHWDESERLEASKSRRRLLFHVDAKPTDEVETSCSVAFKVVTFQETFVAHIDSTGEEAALGTEAHLGPNKAVQDIGEGNGYASICGLITCDWIGAAEDEDLPKRVVLKIPSALPFRKLNDSLPEGQKMIEGNDAIWEMMDGKLRDVHCIEVATYEFFEEFDGLSMPRKYYGKAFGDGEKIGGQICLEYMENSRMMNFHEKHSIELLKQIARAIGKLQACSLKKEPTAPELLKDFFEEFANTITIEAYSGMFKGMAAIDPSDATAALVDGINAILLDYYGSNLAATLHKQMGFRPVLVNGDLRTENVLIDRDSGDLAALIDWQCTHLGVGTEDLLRIAMFALTTEDRRASTTMLVGEMHKSLVANLDGVEQPYSLEKVTDLSVKAQDYLLLVTDLLFPHCALYYAGGCIALITNILKDPKLDDEEKAVRKAVYVDKIVGVLEDILTMHEKNKENLGNLKFSFK